ncbi:Csu type fimbrial protein [Acerihabitans arboris]|uniref:Fimbrial major subunit CsuA/B family protein n=1 Tax=Acerihabitans arboris TaxID=2691583 RepID=A0A845SKZ7_9GAMM|nr:spore coat U domain-containing protein [Acerihabitans arboris]NDL64659.1 fimbrial major subunit CsuA/B family protein [Acerihabitans arboris]
MKELSPGAMFLILCLLCQVAHAACTLPGASVALGTASSFSINSAVSASSGNIQVNCGAGGTLALMSTDYIHLQLYSASNVSAGRAALKYAGGADVIPLQICTTVNCSTELALNGAPAMFNSGQLINLVGLMGGSNFTIPLYMRTMTGQNVAAGTYTLTLNILVNYAICTGIGALGQCMPGSSQTGSAMVPLVVTLVITNDCVTITAANISFGDAPLVSGFNPVSQAVTVVCTKDSTYTVGMGNGNNAVGNVRNMAGGGHLLGYDIYKSTGCARWGDSGNDRWASAQSSGVSSDGTQRTYQYVARILLNQPTPPPGNYSDNVVIDLSF